MLLVSKGLDVAQAKNLNYLLFLQRILFPVVRDWAAND